MTRALSQMTPRNVLPAADLKTDTAIRVLANRLEDGPDWRRRALPARLAPTDAERDLLDARCAVIERWLASARKAAIIRAVGMVRGLMAIPSGASDDALDGYALVLAQFPEPVVEDVCRRFLDGRLGNRVYAPTPAEIAHECRLAVADAQAELGRIRLILDAEIYGTPSEAEITRIREAHAEFIAETAARAKASTPEVKATGSATAERLQAAAELEERRQRREAREAVEAAEAVPSPSEAPPTPV